MVKSLDTFARRHGEAIKSEVVDKLKLEPGLIGITIEPIVKSRTRERKKMLATAHTSTLDYFGGNIRNDERHDLLSLVHNKSPTVVRLQVVGYIRSKIFFLSVMISSEKSQWV